MDKILVCSYNNFEILAHKVKGLVSHIPIGVLDSKNLLLTQLMLIVLIQLLLSQKVILFMYVVNLSMMDIF